MPPESRRRLERHNEILGRWPVIGEAWARAVEEARVGAEPETPKGPLARDDAITPLTAINRALGIADDDGIDAIREAEARQEKPPEATLEEYPSWWKTSGG